MTDRPIITPSDFSSEEVEVVHGNRCPKIDPKMERLWRHDARLDVESERAHKLEHDAEVVYRARIVRWTDDGATPASPWRRATEHPASSIDEHRLNEIAESRAMARALRFYGVGIGAPGAEEIQKDTSTTDSESSPSVDENPQPEPTGAGNRGPEERVRVRISPADQVREDHAEQMREFGLKLRQREDDADVFEGVVDREHADQWVSIQHMMPWSLTVWEEGVDA